METTIWISGCLGLGCVLGGWGHYISTIPRNVVPRSPTLMFVSQPLGLVFATASLALAIGSGNVPIGVMILAGFAIFMALFFFIIYWQRRTPLGDLQVEVGAPMLAFEAMDSGGTLVNSDDWRGGRILLKFYRGHW